MSNHSRKNVLLVGEGNFTYSAQLILLQENFTITATTWNFGTKDVSDIQLENMKFIKEHGGKVFTDVDATCMELHSHIGKQKYDIIIFNFPHRPGKMKIGENRKLLRCFFSSSRNILLNDGEIRVSLCRGQSGIPTEDVHRDWNNTWQIVEQAAFSDIVLNNLTPFETNDFSFYKCTGYRGLEKSFNIDGAFTYIFGHYRATNSLFQDFVHCTETLHDMKEEWLKNKEEIIKLMNTSDAHPFSQALSIIKSLLFESYNSTIIADHGFMELVNNSGCDKYLYFKPDDLPSVFREYFHSHTEELLARSKQDIYPIFTFLPILSSSNIINWKPYFILFFQCSNNLLKATRDILSSYFNMKCSQCSFIWSSNLSSGQCFDTSADVFNILVHYKVVNCSGFRTHTNVTFTLEKYTEESCNMDDNTMVCGKIIYFTHESNNVFCCALDLSCLSMIKYHIYDERILFSNKSYFTIVDNNGSIIEIFRPVCLYSANHVHDVSFWTPKDFSERDMFVFIRKHLYKVLHSIYLIDDYVDQSSLRRSLCYRFVYCGFDEPLCKEKARDIHIMFTRSALAKIFQLDLR